VSVDGTSPGWRGEGGLTRGRMGKKRGGGEKKVTAALDGLYAGAERLSKKSRGGGLVRVLVEERKGEGWVRRGLNPIENFKRIQIISKPSRVLDDPNRTFPSSKNLK
jgi:hypothetical protein